MKRKTAIDFSGCENSTGHVAKNDFPGSTIHRRRAVVFPIPQDVSTVCSLAVCADSLFARVLATEGIPMGLTSAMNTSLNGLALNEVSIDVIGNNIANAGTTGYKASTARFETQLSRTLSIGSQVTSTNGGTNPVQYGLGASTASITRDFTSGSITSTTSPSDLAIEGNGFFVLNGTNGATYTRNGSFTRSQDNYLVNDSGQYVQGYGIDDQFNLVTTSTGNLSIPLGELNVAQQTSTATISGALYPSGALSTQGAISTSEVMTDASTSANVTTGSLLSNVEDGSGNSVFTVGQTLSFSPHVGGKTSDTVSYTVTSSSTMSDFMQFLSGGLGIQSSGTVPNDATTGGQPGITLSGGQITIVGNSGTDNDFQIQAGDLKSNGIETNLNFTKSANANGESATTNFVVYDSLGQTVNVRMTLTLESQGSGSTTYRYYFDSADDSRSGVALGTGTVSFDGNGVILGNSTVPLVIQRDNTGAVSPMSINVNLSHLSGISSASAGSAITLQNQDGSASGTLQSYSIDTSGIINGSFSNGLIRPLGQVVLARFANEDGLVEAGQTSFKAGVNSGAPMITTPGDFGAGTIRSNAIELSNTDIGKSLVDLITASTNYRGNARVISSVQDLTNEILLLGRQ